MKPPRVTSCAVRTRDGRESYAEQSGDGLPTVVLEAGMGSSRLAWQLAVASSHYIPFTEPQIVADEVPRIADPTIHHGATT